MSAAEIERGRTADIEAVVLIYDYMVEAAPYQPLFVGDGKEGIFLNCPGPDLHLHPGQRVRARGRIGPGLFAPELLNPEVTALDGAGLPDPLRPSYEELASGIDDCRWVEVQGVVRSVDTWSGRLRLFLSLGGVHLPITVSGERDVTKRAEDLVDAVVRIRGACRSYFNGQRQLIEPGVYCPGLDAIEVLDRAFPPDQMPSMQIRDLLTYSRDARPGRRVKVRGVTTYHSPGEILFIEDAESGLTVRTNGRALLVPGDVVEVLGFPSSGQSNPTLEDGVYRIVSRGPAPAPRSITAAEASSGKFEAKYVSVRARLLEDARKGARRTMWLQSGSGLFQASQPLLDPAAFRPLPVQSEVIVSGICMARGPLQYRNYVGWTTAAFELLVPAASKVEVLRRPPWWTPPRVMALLGIVAACLVATAAWARALRKRVRQQTALICEQISAQAALQERNRIARELHDTLAQGFAATAFQLEALSDELTAGSPKARSHLNMALTMVRHSLVEARRSVAGLRAEDLARRDLPHALQAAGELLVGNTGAAFEFTCAGATRTLAPGQESHLLRIGQEAVANAARHAHAKRICMELHYGADAVTLRVEDDGEGFDSARDFAARGHYGLRGITERAEEIGAALRIESAAGRGTVIAVKLLHAEILPHGGHAAVASLTDSQLLPRL